MGVEDQAWASCVAAAWKVVDDDLDAAVLDLEGLLESGGVTARGEVAFLLGLARLFQFQPAGPRLRGAAAAFDIAAEAGGDYVAAAAYCYAALAGSTDPDLAEGAWRRVLATDSRSLGPAAAFALGHHYATTDTPRMAEELMASAYASGDPQYQPKAALWLTETYGRAGSWDVVERIRSAVNLGIGPTLRSSSTAWPQLQLPLWRAQLLCTDSTPRVALGAAHALALHDRPSTVPDLLRHLEADVTGGRGDDPSVTAPWWLPVVRTHAERDTAPELAHQLFAVLDRIYTGPALAHAERHVEDPLGLVSRIVHAIDETAWAPLLRGDLRRRLESLPGGPRVPEDWLDH